MMSGQEVATIPFAESGEVRALKQRLHRLHGIPSRFRQRLLCCGDALDDSVKLDSPMDLELVLLAYSTASKTQGIKLLSAAEIGSASEACAC